MFLLLTDRIQDQGEWLWCPLKCKWWLYKTTYWIITQPPPPFWGIIWHFVALRSIWAVKDLRTECIIFQGNCFSSPLSQLKVKMFEGAVFIPVVDQVYSCWISAKCPERINCIIFIFLLVCLLHNLFPNNTFFEPHAWFHLLAITLLCFSVCNLCLGIG